MAPAAKRLGNRRPAARYPCTLMTAMLKPTWSDWMPLLGAGSNKQLPLANGLYRLRRTGVGPVLYIGETGQKRGLRGRVGSLALGAYRQSDIQEVASASCPRHCRFPTRFRCSMCLLRSARTGSHDATASFLGGITTFAPTRNAASYTSNRS